MPAQRVHCIDSSFISTVVNMRENISSDIVVRVIEGGIC